MQDPIGAHNIPSFHILDNKMSACRIKGIAIQAIRRAKAKRTMAQGLRLGDQIFSFGNKGPIATAFNVGGCVHCAPPYVVHAASSVIG
jgi:hypothetical protein